ncbi:hypothetical protein ACT2FY_38955 [Paraburkholderia fungorum]|uniref:hypothetical protein n=1 Tax=Paraburkholderia fungorum TaxID=134537 RepID=UPI00402BA91A
MSNWNDISAQNLRGWIAQLEEMMNKSRKQLEDLHQLKMNLARASAEPDQRTWLDEAIERESDALERFGRSMDQSREWLSLAEQGMLHDPEH